MRAALDTNRLTDLFQGDAELGERLGTCEEVWIPLVVLEPSACEDNRSDSAYWIAALVIEHNLILITRDRHFERIPQLMRE